MNKGLLIAIDGPCASGKGTIAPLLADRIRGVHFYTGSMYRALSLACLRDGVASNDPVKVIKKLAEVNIELRVQNEKETAVYLNSENVSDKIVNSECAVGASNLSRIAEVKVYMVKTQREIARTAALRGIKVIMEGQDIGNHVIPEADFKIFLTADVMVRAKRRLEQYLLLGKVKNLNEVIEETEKRDENDTTRDLNPLSSNPEGDGYFVLDDSNLSEDETLHVIMGELKKKKLL